MKLLFATLLFIFSFSVYAKDGDKKILVQMDQVLQDSGSLEHFLDSKDQQKKYFELAKKYYGEIFETREAAYWHILEQLKEVKQRNPELAQRLWETDGLGKPFMLDLNVRGSGLNLNSKNFGDYVRELQNNALSFVRNTLGEDATEEQKQKWVKERLQEFSGDLDKQVSEIDKSVENMPKAERISERGKKFASLQKSILENPRYTELKNILLAEMLSKEQAGDALRSGSADIVVEFLGNLSKSENNLFAMDGLEDLTKKFHPYLIKMLPQELINPEKPPLEVKNGLARATRFFVAKTKKTRHGLIASGKSSGAVEFKPLPRRFHGIMKGIALGECVAGGEACENITPERWGVTALRESQHYYLETEGSYQGWVSLFPGIVDGKEYTNVEFGSSMLANQVDAKVDGKIVKKELYNFAVTELEKQQSPESLGLIVGDSQAIGNSGVLGRIQDSLSYELSPKLTHDFVNLDNEAVKALIDSGHNNGYAKHYAGNGIIDANLKKNTLTVLKEYDLKDVMKLLKEMSRPQVSTLLRNHKIKLSPNYLEYVKIAVSENICRDFPLLSELSRNYKSPGALEALQKAAFDGAPEAWTLLKKTGTPIPLDIVKRALMRGEPDVLGELSRHLENPEAKEILKRAYLNSYISSRDAENIFPKEILNEMSHAAYVDADSDALLKMTTRMSQAEEIRFLKEAAIDGNTAAVRLLLKVSNENPKVNLFIKDRDGILTALKSAALNGNHQAVEALIALKKVDTLFDVKEVAIQIENGKTNFVDVLKEKYFKKTPGAKDAIKKLAEEKYPFAMNLLADNPQSLDQAKTMLNSEDPYARRNARGYLKIKRTRPEYSDDVLEALKSSKFDKGEISKILFDCCQYHSWFEKYNDELILEGVEEAINRKIHKFSTKALETLIDKGSAAATRAFIHKLKGSTDKEYPTVMMKAARNGNRTAIDDLAGYLKEPNKWVPDVYPLFLELADEGNYRALEAISPYSSDPKVYEILKKWADQGSSTATGGLEAYFDKPEIQDLVFKKFVKKDSSAIRIIKNNIDNPAVLDFLKKQGLEGNEQALKILLQFSPLEKVKPVYLEVKPLRDQLMEADLKGTKAKLLAKLKNSSTGEKLNQISTTEKPSVVQRIGQSCKGILKSLLRVN